MDFRLNIFGLVFFAAGLVLLFVSIWWIYKRIRFKASDDPRQKQPRKVGLALILPMIIFILLGQGFFWLSSQLKFYRPAARDYGIGTIEINRLNDPVKSLEVAYTPVYGDSSAVPSRFYLSGDSWRFKGEIINFKFAHGLL
jgi:hypothetical protein